MTTNLARLTNTGVNIVGGTTSLTTTYGPTSILVAGNNFDVSSSGTLTMGSTGNVTIGNTGAGFITRFNAPITLGPAPGSVGTNTATPLLGQFMSVTIATGNNSPTASIQIVTPGVYILTYRLIGSGTGVLGSYFMTGTSLAGSIVQTQPNEYYSTATSILIVAAGTYALTASFFSGAVSVTSGNVTFCRIG